MRIRIFHVLKGCIILSALISMFLGTIADLSEAVYLCYIDAISKEDILWQFPVCTVTLFILCLVTFVIISIIYFTQMNVWDNVHKEKCKEQVLVFYKLLPDLKIIVGVIEDIGTPIDK